MQVGQIHTADQQHRSDRGQQEPEGSTNTARNFLRQRFHDDTGIGSPVSDGSRIRLLQTVQFALCLCPGNSSPEAANDQVVVVAAHRRIGQERFEYLIGAHRALHNRSRHFTHVREAEALGRNSDHSLWNAAKA